MRTTILAAIIPFLASAGEINLSGKVYDNSGKPVFGADVRVSKAGVYTATGPDGSWQIAATVPDSGRSAPPDTLVYSLQGNEVERVFLPTWFQVGIGQVLSGSDDLESPLDEDVACSEADQTAKPAEQGKYARQSITHVDGVVLRGNARFLSPSRVENIRSRLRGLRLPRFDDNPLPDGLSRRFLGQVGGYQDLSNDQIAKMVESDLLPSIKQVLKLKGLGRAADLRSEFQKNSMVSDKTKTTDITGEQLLSVMNAAWIYVPVVNSVSTSSEGGIDVATVSMSILWYHIRCDGPTGKVRPVLEKVVTGTGFMTVASSSGINPFESAVKSCVRDLLTRTKEMEAFSISGQITDKDGLGVEMDIGEDQGVLKNDQYALVENVKASNDSSKQVEVGWVKVFSRGDSTSRARTVSGKPYVGLALKEIPLSSWSLEFGYLHEPVAIDETACVERGYAYSYGTYNDCSAPSTRKHGSLNGLQLNAYYGLSWWYGISVGTGVNLLFGSEFATDLKFSLRQSIPVYRRFSVYAEPELALRILPAEDPRTSTDAQGNQSSVPPAVLQMGVIYGLEWALAPDWNLRVGMGASDIAGLEYYSSGDRRKMSDDGMTFGIQFQWTPKGMPVDPMDLMLGQAWNPNATKRR